MELIHQRAGDIKKKRRENELYKDWWRRFAYDTVVVVTAEPWSCHARVQWRDFERGNEASRAPFPSPREEGGGAGEEKQQQGGNN